MRRLLSASLLAVLMALPAGRAADDDDLAKVLGNLATMFDIAESIERYAIGHGALPAAKSPAELSRAIVGSESGAQYLVDPWGTPYAIDSDPARHSYTIAGAGSDRKFDRATWSQAAQTSDSAADVVLVDGVLVRSPREWALAELEKRKHDTPAILKQSLENTKAMRTRVSVFLLDKALGDYKMATGRYPRGTSDEIVQALEKKKFIFERNDGWGTPFRVTVSKDAKSYSIVSAGADRTFSKDLPAAHETVTDYTKDLVYTDGDFVREWKEPDKDPVDAAWTSLQLFELKYKFLKMMSPEERRKLRRDTLLAELDRSREGPLAVISKYEALEKIEPGFVDLDRLLGAMRAVYDLTPPAPPPPPPPAVKIPPLPKAEDVITPAEKAEAAERMAAVLRRVIAANPDELRAVAALARLEVKRGRVAEGEAVLQRYRARHPRDVKAAETGQDIATFLGRPVDLEELVRLDPKYAEGWYRIGVDRYHKVARTATLSVAEKRSMVDRGIKALDRAIELKPDYFEAMVYENLLYRQLALTETDPQKAQEAIAKGNALRDRAIAITKEKKAKAR